MKISQDFEEFIRLLNRNEVKYLIVGGYAFSVHARPRFTNDMDIWIDREEDNAAKVLETLKQFGFGSLDIKISDLTEPDMIIQLGNPPFRIDLLTSIDGITFQKAWNHKETGKYGEEKMNLISKNDLIKNKKACNRKKDKRDLDELLNF
mgnify:CR=1 FL=1